LFGKGSQRGAKDLQVLNAAQTPLIIGHAPELLGGVTSPGRGQGLHHIPEFLISQAHAVDGCGLGDDDFSEPPVHRVKRGRGSIHDLPNHPALGGLVIGIFREARENTDHPV
jgi:hypothetical protein